jgi:PhzF family phenazine biosynthesis protein
MRALRWTRDDLDARYPAHIAYDGNEHLILALRDRTGSPSWDYPALAALMADRAWTTLQLVRAHTWVLFAARDPFPPGGVVEDPATGAAAAAFGGYLRALGLVDVPAPVTLLQGEDMRRPSRLLIDISNDDDRVRVTGTASALPDA